MRVFILALVAIIGCGAVANSNVVKTYKHDATFNTLNYEVTKLEFDGKTYHVINGSDWGRVFDVTEKN